MALPAWLPTRLARLLTYTLWLLACLNTLTSERQLGFLLVNLFKLPLLIQLGVLDFSTLQFSASFMLFSVLGAMIAPLIVQYLNQRIFEFLVWSFIIIGGIKLLIL